MSELLPRADASCQHLSSGPSTSAQIDEATGLLLLLRNAREFERLCALAEQVCRHRPDDSEALRLYAQGLLETGRLSAALHLLQNALAQFGSGDPQWSELSGLLGRVGKQLMVDTPGPFGNLHARYLRLAFQAYDAAYQQDRTRHFWHGINLAALAAVADRCGAPPPGQPAEVYLADVLAHLDRCPATARDRWWHATKLEAYAARGDWDAADAALRNYLESPEITAFMVGSTLRQLRDVWELPSQGEEGAGLVQMLEARLLRWPEPGTVLTLERDHLARMRTMDPATAERLQGAIGPQGVETVDWYRRGLRCAGSVASLKELYGLRFGTGFAMHASVFSHGHPSDTRIWLLTNHHVLNSTGLQGRRSFDNVEVTFEALDGPACTTMRIDRLLAESPVQGGLDYALFQLQGDTAHLPPVDVDLSRELPAPGASTRVYLIGHLLGHELQFSLHDNLLLDHECGPQAHPTVPERRLLHYSTSSETGSSGSPVFDAYWRCIGLHQAGGKTNAAQGQYGLPALNGQNRMVQANQGIWIVSVIDHARAQLAAQSP